MGEGRGRWAVAQILILIQVNLHVWSDRPFFFPFVFIFFLLFSVDTKAEKRRKSEEVDPMDPAAYSDAPRYFFALKSRMNASTLTIIIL